MGRCTELVCAALLVVGLAGCSPPLSEEAVPSDCAVDVQYEGRLLFDPLVVEEGQLLAVRIDGQPTGGLVGTCESEGP